MISPGPISSKYAYPVTHKRIYIMIHYLDTGQLDLWPSLPIEVATEVTKILNGMPKVDFYTFERRELPR